MLIKAETWIAWIAGSVLTVLTLGVVVTSFVYAEFETKDAAKERTERIEKSLDRIEDKVDALTEGAFVKKSGR